MVNYAQQELDQDDIDAVISILKSPWLTQGPTVDLFQNELSAYCSSEYAVAVNSATSALHITCLALGIRQGDLVWVSPISFVASANCALYCGAQIDFVDINLATYNICLDALEEKLVVAKKRGKLPKLLIAVHYAGQSCDMRGLKLLSAKYGFKIIEDAAHAIGGEYLGRKIGCCEYSEATIFSFHPVKIITSGEGGCVVTNCPEIANKCRILRSHGIDANHDNKYNFPLDQIRNYAQVDLGFNYRMTDICAALGLSQLKKIDKFVGRRHEIAKQYDEAFGDLNIVLPFQSTEAFSSFHLYPIRLSYVPDKNYQKAIYESFHQRHVFVNLHYIPIYKHPYFQAIGFGEEYCPNAEIFYKSVLVLPMHVGLKKNQIDLVISTARELLG